MKNFILVVVVILISVISLSASELDKSRCVGKCNKEMRTSFEKCRKDNSFDGEKRDICYDVAREKFRLCTEKCREID
jgi:hypothetical protein